MTTHSVQVKIVLIDGKDKRTTLVGPDSIRYTPKPFTALEFPGAVAFISKHKLPADAEPLTVGDYPTGVITEAALIVHLDDTETTRLRLSKDGWLPERG